MAKQMPPAETAWRAARDVLAPDAVQEHEDHVRLGSFYAAYLMVGVLPRKVPPFFLRAFQGVPDVDLLVQARTHDKDGALRTLGSKGASFQGSMQAAMRSGQATDKRAARAADDVEGLAAEISAERNGLSHVRLLLRVLAPDPETLEERVERVRTAFPGRLVRLTHQHLPAHESFLPGRGCQVLGSNLAVDTRTLAYAAPFTRASMAMDGGLVLGYDLASDDLVAIDFFGFPSNNNGIVVGRSGSGKSFLIKTIISRALLQWPDVQVLIIDPNPKREYQHIVRSYGGAAVEVGQDVTINPLEMLEWGSTPAEFAGLVKEKIGQVKMILGIMIGAAGRLEKIEETVADLALVHLYRERWQGSRIAPTLSDFLQVLDRIHRAGAAAAIGWERGADANIRAVALSMGDRLGQFTTGTLSWLNQPSRGLQEARIIVFNMGSVAESELPLLMSIVAAYFTQIIFSRKRNRKILIMDEAWRAFQVPGASSIMGGVARVTRHGRAALVTAAQRLSDFERSPEAADVLTQSAFRFILKQEPEEISSERLQLFGLSGEGLLDFLRNRQNQGDVLFATELQRVAFKAIVTDSEQELFETDPEKAALRQGRH